MLEAAQILDKVREGGVIHTQSQSKYPNQGLEPNEKERADEGYILAPIHVLAVTLLLATGLAGQLTRSSAQERGCKAS